MLINIEFGLHKVSGVPQGQRGVEMNQPNKFLNSAKLEHWCNTFYFETLDEWECSEVVELIDFWDWLDRTYPEILAEFKAAWTRDLTSSESVV